MKNNKPKKVMKKKTKILIRDIIFGAVVVAAIVALILWIVLPGKDDSGESDYAKQHAKLEGHGFLPQWSTNATHHWHDCKYKTCTETIDRGEHTWDEGEMTTVPTYEFDGEIKYVCTVCKRSKTEPITFEQVRWNGTFAENTFDNFTFQQIITTNIKNDDGSTSVRVDNDSYALTTDKAYFSSFWMLDGSPETLANEIIKGDSLAAKRKQITAPVLSLLSDTSKYDYDKENDAYVAKSDMTADIAIDGTTTKPLTLKNLKIDFYLKNISEVSFTYMNGENEISVVWKFYHFGTTVVNE